MSDEQEAALESRACTFDDVEVVLDGHLQELLVDDEPYTESFEIRLGGVEAGFLEVEVVATAGGQRFGRVTQVLRVPDVHPELTGVASIAYQKALDALRLRGLSSDFKMSDAAVRAWTALEPQAPLVKYLLTWIASDADFEALRLLPGFKDEERDDVDVGIVATSTRKQRWCLARSEADVNDLQAIEPRWKRAEGDGG